MGISANPANTGHLVEKFVNTAYDKVETVHDNLAEILRVADISGSRQAGTVLPTTRADGSALIGGDTFFHETTNIIYNWNSVDLEWIPSNYTDTLIETITVDATMTSTGTITLTNPYIVSENNLFLFINGVFQGDNNYTKTDANTIDFGASILELGDKIVAVVAKALGSAVVTDADQVLYTPSGTGAVVTDVQSKLRQIIHIDDFSGASDPIKIQAAFDSVGSTPAHFIFAARDYAIDETVSFTAPENSSVEAYGARFICSHNGVAFDLNPDATAQLPIAITADTYTKRNITWSGGVFVNTNLTKTASVAMQLYYMRVVRIRDVRIGSTSANQGFFRGFRFGGKDTYFFDKCYVYDCIRAYEVPEEGILHPPGLTGNDLIDVFITGQIASSPAGEWGIYIGSRSIGLDIGCNINGQLSAGHVKIKDGSVVSTRGVNYHAHTEQGLAGIYVLDFDDSRGLGFEGVAITAGTEISSANIGWLGIKLSRCKSVDINRVHFVDGSGGTTEQCIYIDDNCRDVVINTDTCYFGSITSGNEVVLQSATGRANVTLIPENVILTAPLNMTGYNGVGVIATQSILLDVASLISLPGNLVPKLPPKAWLITASFKNTTGAGTPSVGTCRLRLTPANASGTGSLSSQTGITIWTGGLPDLFTQDMQGVIPANADGNLWLDILTTHDNATVHLNVQGYIQ